MIFNQPVLCIQASREYYISVGKHTEGGNTFACTQNGKIYMYIHVHTHIWLIFLTNSNKDILCFSTTETLFKYLFFHRFCVHHFYFSIFCPLLLAEANVIFFKINFQVPTDILTSSIGSLKCSLLWHLAYMFSVIQTFINLWKLECKSLKVSLSFLFFHLL